MKRWIKWTLGAPGALVVAAAAAVVRELAERKSRRQVAVKLEPVAWADMMTLGHAADVVTLARGCTECHGVDGGRARVHQRRQGCAGGRPQHLAGRGQCGVALQG